HARVPPSVPWCSLGARGCRPGPSVTWPVPMETGTWTIKPCAQAEAAQLARELEIAETTARVLIRRGYDSAESATSFLAGELPGHDPFLLGDMRGACEAIRSAVSARKP